MKSNREPTDLRNDRNRLLKLSYIENCLPLLIFVSKRLEKILNRLTLDTILNKYANSISIPTIHQAKFA